MSEVIRMSKEDQTCFAEALLHPPEPTEALKKALQRRKEFVQDLVATGMDDLAAGRVVPHEEAKSRLEKFGPGFEAREVRPGVIQLYSRLDGRLVKGVGYYCQDCATVKDKFMDYYAAQAVWEEAGMESPGSGMLCVACLRERIGRDLLVDDLKTFHGFAEDASFLPRINAGLKPSDARKP